MWQDLVRKLLDSGLTQPQLAQAAQCGQSTISDLLTGRTTDPRSSTAFALIRLARERLPDHPMPMADGLGVTPSSTGEQLERAA